MFTLPDTETDEMGCEELCARVHTAQRKTSAQILIGFSANLSVSVQISVNVPSFRIRLQNTIIKNNDYKI